MKIVHLTAGTGSFLCGTCLRDNALVAALRDLGHEVHMVPLYLPLVVDEASTADAPVFFGGVNVYLQQKSALFRRTPRALDALLDTPLLLGLAGRRAGASRPEELGDLTLSMLEGERGNQSKELARLVAWLASGPARGAAWVCLSNALLVGMARRIKEATGARVACTFQGEDTFLDAMPEPFREASWRELGVRAAELDAIVAVSGYHGALMARRLGLPEGRVEVVHNGIHTDGFVPAEEPPVPPVVGYLARMCRDKGLHTLVEAFIRLRERGARAGLRLHVAGAMTSGDEGFVRAEQARLAAAGLDGDTSFAPNIDRAAKQAFLRGLSVFSVPATYGESFGLYVLEALAAGVPVVAPRHGAFPEVLGLTGGGLLCAPDDPASLAAAIDRLLSDERERRALAAAGRAAVLERFSAERMADDFARALGAPAAGARRALVSK